MSKMLLVFLFSAFLLVFDLFLPVRAQAVDAQVSSTSLNFGSVTINSSSPAKTITVTNPTSHWTTVQNIVSSSPQFVISGVKIPLSMAPNSTATFTVVFRPTAAQSYSGTITLSNFRGESPVYVSVSGTGSSTAAPLLSLSPSAGSVAFGSLPLGSSAAHSVSFTNSGTGSVTVSAVAVSGAGFAVNGFSAPVTLPAGQSLALTLDYAPTQAGSASGTLTVTSNASNSPTTVTLSGTATQSQIALTPAAASFGSVTTGVTNTQSISISNHGTANLTITQASESGAGFTYSGLSFPLTIAPGAASSFVIAFAPTTAGSFNGTLTLANSSATPSIAVALSGTGVAKVLQLGASPSTLSFGNVTTGSSVSQPVTLTNTGNANVSLSSDSVKGTGFTVSGMALPVTLSPGQSASLTVGFAPTVAGSATGSVSVASNASNSPSAISVSGSGVAPATHSVALSWTPSSSSFSGFNLYRATVSGGPYTKLDSALLTTQSFTDANVTNGQTYYYVATEVDTSGNESAHSTAISVTIP